MVPLFFCPGAFAQNASIKCYFNHPVNTTISTGLNAAYLNASFPDTIAAYISRAKFTVDIAMYNYSSNTFNQVYKIAQAANEAAARGVVIRWIHNGTSATANTGLSLLSSSIKTFAAPNNNGYIMHNKFMVIDVNSPDTTDAVIQTGSYNFSDAQTLYDYNNIVIVQSKQVALAYYREFNKMWGGTAASPLQAASAFSTAKTASTQTIFNVNGTTIEVYFSPKDSIGKHLQNNISSSNFDLFFGVYTFTDNTIANLIKTKYNSGVVVKGIMDQFSLPFNAYAILHPVLGNNLLIHSDTTLYHNKILLADALNPESDPLVFTGSFNWSGGAQNSNDENAIVIHDAAIANQYYQSLCKDYTTLGGTACAAQPCGGRTISLISSITGSNYQWQLNIGNGFTSIIDTGNYIGTAGKSLTINAAPTNWYGYQYRCLVNGSSSDTTTLKFVSYWNGSIDSTWENPANWNCGLIPDANTDVVIRNSVHIFPSVKSNTSCHSITIAKGAAAILAGGINLILTGK